MIVISAWLSNCYNCDAFVSALWENWWWLLPALYVCALFHVCVYVYVTMTDRTGRPGQSQGGSDLHRHRPSPLYHSELWHHCGHVQGLCDWAGSAWPAHGPEGSLLQAGDNRSTHQLAAQGHGSQTAIETAFGICKGPDQDPKYIIPFWQSMLKTVRNEKADTPNHSLWWHPDIIGTPYFFKKLLFFFFLNTWKMPTVYHNLPQRISQFVCNDVLLNWVYKNR